MASHPHVGKLVKSPVCLLLLMILLIHINPLVHGMILQVFPFVQETKDLKPN